MKVNQRAFSLIELLVVMAIIGILSVMTVAGFDSIRGRELSGAVLSCQALVAQARQSALQSGGRARLLVAREGGGSFQQMVVVREARGSDDTLFSANGGAPRFESASPVMLLKDGLFFIEDESDLTNSMKFNPKIGGQQDGSSGTEWLYLEFGANGSLLDSAGKLILGRGKREGTEVALRPGRGNLDGFFVSRLGRPISLQNPDTAP